MARYETMEAWEKASAEYSTDDLIHFLWNRTFEQEQRIEALQSQVDAMAALLKSRGERIEAQQSQINRLDQALANRDTELIMLRNAHNALCDLVQTFCIDASGNEVLMIFKAIDKARIQTGDHPERTSILSESEISKLLSATGVGVKTQEAQDEPQICQHTLEMAACAFEKYPHDTALYYDDVASALRDMKTGRYLEAQDETQDRENEADAPLPSDEGGRTSGDGATGVRQTITNSVGADVGAIMGEIASGLETYSILEPMVDGDQMYMEEDDRYAICEGIVRPIIERLVERADRLEQNNLTLAGELVDVKMERDSAQAEVARLRKKIKEVYEGVQKSWENHTSTADTLFGVVDTALATLREALAEGKDNEL